MFWKSSLILLFICLTMFPQTQKCSSALTYPQIQERGPGSYPGSDYGDYYGDWLLSGDTGIQKRGSYCIRFGKGCSKQGILCCGSNVCRCNLFGSNCRCQRSGLFGKKR